MLTNFLPPLDAPTFDKNFGLTSKTALITGAGESLVCSIGSRIATAALFTRRSVSPARSAICRAPSASARSAIKTSQPISFCRVTKSASVRLTATTRALERWSKHAISRPIPLPAPVTNARRFLKSSWQAEGASLIGMEGKSKTHPTQSRERVSIGGVHHASPKNNFLCRRTFVV